MMTQRPDRHLLIRARRKQRQEGVVLLIVMLLLTMLTATATFAFNNTAVDQRAAGAYRMAVTSAYTADSSALATAALGEDLRGAVQLFGDGDAWGTPAGAQIRQQLGLPAPATPANSPRLVQGESAFEGANFVVQDPVATNKMESLAPPLSGASPRAAPFGTPYQRRFYSPVDVWPIPNPNAANPGQPPLLGNRFIIMAVGDISPRAVDVNPAVAGARTKHQTVSITRAHVQVQ